MNKNHPIAIVAILVGILVFAAQAEFYPERIYKERSKTSLNYGWKFFKGTPSGTPSDSSFNDAGWQSVNIPHSASYDDPLADCSNLTVTGNVGEASYYIGNCWYRKYFTVPASAKHKGKIMLEFEGAMQIAKVWVNGKLAGTHDNSGYTWFQFDITDKVSLNNQNVIAVQLDNTPNGDIPPGRTGDAGVGYSDYFLFSGLYRNVWLVCTDQCNIPLWSQRISIPVATASTASAQVHIVTPVISSTPGSIKINYTIAYPANQPVAFASQTITLGSANGKAVFDTLVTLSNPTLWTYRTPNLYYLYTQVFQDGVLVDDYVDRFGVRWYTWTASGGFSLNGVFDTLRGASLHQSIGWIESALPRSRFFKEVGLVKEMGANLIRCAHFPRAPSFYNACDELGMLVMVEVPTWGCCTSKLWSDAFFTRLDSCMRELIEVGYNHPSIISWGMFNEPNTAFNLANQIPSEGAVAHQMDSTRYTYIADNNCTMPEVLNETDIEGMNYNELSGACATMVKRIINTEYHEGWQYWCYRGAPTGTSGQKADDLSSGGYAYQRWNDWTGLLGTARTNKLAGAVMWSFNDYWSFWSGGVHPMGAVDHMRIPKAVFYLFRKYWTGVKDSVPVPLAGHPVAQLRLDCDNSILVADSTDVAIITASFRDASGLCVDYPGVINTNTVDSTPVTFTVSGLGDYFGSNVKMAYGGKCAIMVKSKNRPGAITVSASATAGGTPLTATPVTIQCVQTDTSSLPFLAPVVNHVSMAKIKSGVTMKQRGNRVVISFSDKRPGKTNLVILNAGGKMVSCPVAASGADLVVDTRDLATGYYVFSAKKAACSSTKRIFVAK